MARAVRMHPNFLITGTPGVGKSAIANAVADLCKLKWVNINELAKKNEITEEYDERYTCPIIDDVKMLDLIQHVGTTGGTIVEFDWPSVFPEDWFDLIFVITTEEKALHDRLWGRGYYGTKLETLLSREIFRHALVDAQESYSKNIVVEMDNTYLDQLNDVIFSMCKWISTKKMIPFDDVLFACFYSFDTTITVDI